MSTLEAFEEDNVSTGITKVWSLIFVLLDYAVPSSKINEIRHLAGSRTLIFPHWSVSV